MAPLTRPLALCAFVCFATVPLAARAEVPSVDARTFQPSTDPASSLSVEPVAVAPKWAFGTGAFFHYSYRPVTVRRGDTDVAFSRPLEHVVGGDVIANLSLGHSAVGIALPYVIGQTGDDRLTAPVSSSDRAPLAAIGDLSLEAKAPFKLYDTAGFGLGMKTRVTLPSGDRQSFAGAGTTRVELRLLAEYSLLIVTAHASVGYMARFDQTQWPTATGPIIGDEIRWAAGFRLRPKPLGVDDGDRQMWEVAARGSLPAGTVGPFGSGEPGSAQLSTALLGVSNRIALGETRDAFVIAGADVGLTNALGVPAVRGIVGLGWMPREHDQDHDGVRDDRDQCPEIPEDRDGFEDGDGCPEIDDDDDGVLDREDVCPRVAGVEMAGPRNGCPAPDSDRDGVPDASDACRDKRGTPSANPRLNGCPHEDTDGDGVPDAIDRCPNVAEDKDGHFDEDGCPDDDDDGDGVPDRSDACPKLRGDPSSDPTRNGCPVRDRDGDAFDDAADKCPDAAEVYNGVDDDDGCPDAGGAALVSVETRAGKSSLRLLRPIKLGGSASAPTIDPVSLPMLRAVSLELSRHRDFTLTVGARPASTKETDMAAALARATAVAAQVRSFSQRDTAAEVVTWDAVKAEPNAAATGLGLGIVVAPTPPTPASKAAAPPPSATAKPKP